MIDKKVSLSVLILLIMAQDAHAADMEQQRSPLQHLKQEKSAVQGRMSYLFNQFYQHCPDGYIRPRVSGGTKWQPQDSDLYREWLDLGHRIHEIHAEIAELEGKQ